MKSVITVADIAAVFVVGLNSEEDHKNRIGCTLRLLEAIFMAILVLD